MQIVASSVFGYRLLLLMLWLDSLLYVSIIIIVEVVYYNYGNQFNLMYCCFYCMAAILAVYYVSIRLCSIVFFLYWLFLGR